MQVVPISDTDSQTVQVQLASQNCKINLYQKSTGFYCDLYVSDTLIIGGVICQNLNRIVRDTYLGFTGDLVFLDTQGSTTLPSNGSDPSSPGLGTRYLLCYLSTTDLESVT
ncbi:phage baseplate plug family protein [Paraburkholderia tropica]|uniref:phage baseplate plug family protein n=1 Tax=Paraburkholderia tropica TaxID=92647 RepID=UPI0038BB1564